LIIKGDDLCVATHGRGFWILDNITPLRQLQDSKMKQPAVLFRPRLQCAFVGTRTPIRRSHPTNPPVKNPPEGAMIDYYIGTGTMGPVTLELKDEMGHVVRSYSSSDPVPTPDPTLNIPPYWIRPPQKLSNEQGLNRFFWDLHYAPVPGVPASYPIAAIYRNTAPDPTSPWTMPGSYTVVLTVGGKSYQQPLTLVMDPRVKTSNADLAEQFKLSKQLYDESLMLNPISESVKRTRDQIVELQKRTPNGDLKTHLNALADKLQALSVAAPGAPSAGGPARLNLATTSGRVKTLFDLMQDVDLAPTPQAAAAIPGVIRDSRRVQEDWQMIKSQDIAALNLELRAAGLPLIDVIK